MNIDISLIILSYNTADYLRKCIDSVFRHTSGIEYEVIVVDNSSSDGSPEMVETLDRDIILIRNSSNLGFAKANNLAIRHAKGRYIVLMNSDIELLNNALGDMVFFMDKHPEAGAVGPRTWANPDRTLLWCGAQHFSPALLLYKTTPLGRVSPLNNQFLRYWEEDFTMAVADGFCEVDTIGGHCLLMRKEVIEKCGLLDENFFFYFEDADWSIRVRKKGFKLYHLVSSEIVHHLWKSSSDNENVSEYYLDSLKYFMAKNYGLTGTLTLKGLSILEYIKQNIPFKSSIKKLIAKNGTLQRDVITEGQELNITWDEDMPQRSGYIIQLSFTNDFIPSGIKKVTSNTFTLHDSFMSSWPDGVYFWRVLPADDQYHPPIRTGSFIKQFQQ